MFIFKFYFTLVLLVQFGTIVVLMQRDCFYANLKCIRLIILTEVKRKILCTPSGFLMGYVCLCCANEISSP